MQSKPEGTAETFSLKMRQFFLFMPRSRENLTLKKIFNNARSLQENNACSAANRESRWPHG